MISALYFSPMPKKRATAASRASTVRATARSAVAMRCISASMRSRSSGVNARSKEKS